jgi:hypothetical protein
MEKAARELLEKNGFPSDDGVVNALIECCSSKSGFKRMTSTMRMYVEEFLIARANADAGSDTEEEDDDNHAAAPLVQSWYQMVTGEKEEDWKKVTWVDNERGTCIRHNQTGALYNAGKIVRANIYDGTMERKRKIPKVPLDIILEHGDLCDYLGNARHTNHMFQLLTMSNGLQTDRDVNSPNYFQSYVDCNTPNTRACIMTAAASIARRDHGPVSLTQMLTSQLLGKQLSFYSEQYLSEIFQSVNGVLESTGRSLDLFRLQSGNTLEQVSCIYHNGCSVDFQVSHDSKTITPNPNPFPVHLVCVTTTKIDDEARRDFVIDAAYRNAYGAAVECNASHLWLQLLNPDHLKQTLRCINYIHKRYRSNLQVHIIDPLHLCQVQNGKLKPL